MTSHVRSMVVIALTLGLAGGFAACTATAITGNDGEGSTVGTALARPTSTGKLATNLIECPVNEATSTSSTIGPLGGVVSLGGTSISIPAGALLGAETVTVSYPASNLMEIDISVAGSTEFIFELPVTVTLSYARCNRTDINATPLSVWHIDSETNALLEFMGGIDNKLLRTITFTTGHLSGYAVAN